MKSTSALSQNKILSTALVIYSQYTGKQHERYQGICFTYRHIRRGHGSATRATVLEMVLEWDKGVGHRLLTNKDIPLGSRTQM